MTAWLGRFLVLGAVCAIVLWPAVAIVVDTLPAARPMWTEASGGLMRPAGLAANTVKLVGLTIALALPPGIALAWLIERSDLFGRTALENLARLGLFIPLPLVALAWLGALGNWGRLQVLGGRPILAGLPGAAVVHAIASIPWVALVVSVGLRGVEREHELAARLDQPAWKVALGVSLRRSTSAIAAAALLVAVLTAGDMTVTDLVYPQVRTYAEEAYLQAQLGGAGAAVAAPQAIAIGAILIVVAWTFLRADPPRQATARAGSGQWPLDRFRAPVSVVAWFAAAILLALPIYALVWRAGRVGGAPGRPPHWSLPGLAGTIERSWQTVAEPLAQSALWAGLGATGSLALGFGLAWLARESRAWRAIAVLAITLAWAAPGPVAGSALKLAYNPALLSEDANWLARLDFAIRAWIHDTPALLVLGYVLRTFPFALAILWPAARRFPREWLETATLDGLKPARRLVRIVLPLLRTSLAAAWIAAFALALGELPVTYIVTPPGQNPLSLVIWGLLHTGVESHLAGAGLLVLGVVAIVGGVATWGLQRQRT
jgi:iron(III) transport system permease protein